MELPRRYSFNFFLEEIPQRNEPEIESFYIENGHDVFGGRELLIDDKKLTYYFYPIEEHSCMLLLFLGEDFFDELMKNLNEDNADEVAKVWPKFTEAFINGRNDSDSQYALARCEFKDTQFWTTYCRLENVDFQNMETEYVIGKLIRLCNFSVDMLNEISTNEPSALRIFGRGVVNSTKSSLKMMSILKSAIAVGGLIFGVDVTGLLGGDQ